ncbi:MAG: hypothetical protein KF770_30580 [Anaerolineae bacterium]|nr:hypothetical protein [Anaerolineae bacterium]
MRHRAGFGTRQRPSSRVLTWPNGATHTTTVTYDHEGENTLVGGGSTLVTAVRYNDMGQLKRLSPNNGLTTWYGYLGYSAASNNDAYDATWGQFGKLTVTLVGRQRMGATVNWCRERMWGHGRRQ